MQDSTLLLVAGVGLALVCIGVFVVGLIMLLRGVGSPLWTALFGGGDDEHRRIVRGTTKPDLRSIAQGASSDFDAALAQPDAQTQSTPSTPLSADSPPFAPAPPRIGTRQSPLRPTSDDDDDDLLGAVLDDDEF